MGRFWRVMENVKLVHDVHEIFSLVKSFDNLKRTNKMELQKPHKASLQLKWNQLMQRPIKTAQFDSNKGVPQLTQLHHKTPLPTTKGGVHCLQDGGNHTKEEGIKKRRTKVNLSVITCCTVYLSRRVSSWLTCSPTAHLLPYSPASTAQRCLGFNCRCG